MKSKTTLELNGKRYDALTGNILGAASAPPVKSAHNIDGFFRGRSTVAMGTKVKSPHSAAAVHDGARQRALRNPNHAAAHRPQAATTSTDRTQNIRVKSTPKQQANHTDHAVGHTHPHKPQPTKTLMRTAVSRPKPGFKQQANVQSNLQHKVPSLIASKKSVYAVNAERLARAKSVATSPLIAHHGALSVPGMPVSVVPIPVQPQPKPNTDVQPAPSPQPSNKPTDIFEHAIANASHFVDVKSHRKHSKKQARKHVLSLSAGTLALIVIGGYTAYMNSPGLQYKVASVKAGVPGTIPNLKAAGFNYDGAQADSGKVTVGFTSKTGQYQLVQQTTNWSGSDMIQNIGSTDASGYPTYSTLQVGDTTVYRFDNTGVTWVSNGRWYTVSGNTMLTDSQIQALVASAK